MSITTRFRIGTRSRHRRRCRPLNRYDNRMLAGIPRPRPPDEIAIICRCFKQIFKIDESLRPYMEEQIRLQQSRAFDREIQAALDRVYGPTKTAPR